MAGATTTATNKPWQSGGRLSGVAQPLQDLLDAHPLLMRQLVGRFDRQHAAAPVASIEHADHRLPRGPIQMFQFRLHDV
jgi:hypothetical protein